jgi:hypothetical protein
VVPARVGFETYRHELAVQVPEKAFSLLRQQRAVKRA